MKIKRESRNLLIGLSIGDGYINKKGFIDIWHSPEQKEFVDYKYSLIKEYCNIKPQTIIRGSFQSYGFRTKCTPFIKVLRRILYKKEGKTLTRKLLDRLSIREIAIWWMDDGSMSKKINKNTGNIKALVFTLSTCCSKEQNQIIIDWFLEKYNIRFGQRKMRNSYALICGTKEGKKLSKLLEPEIIPSMKYKIFID